MALHARLDNGLLTKQQKFAEYDRRHYLNVPECRSLQPSEIKPYQTQTNFKKAYEVATHIKSNLH